MLRAALIGCGSVGQRRAEVMESSANTALVAVSDADQSRAAHMARAYSADLEPDWEVLLQRADIEAIAIATPNYLHARIGLAALQAGKHVLIEKPLACSVEDAEALVDAAKKSQCVLHTGFNHRWYPNIQKAHQMINEGVIGEPFLARCIYGHGGPGAQRTWFASKEFSGGGTVLDNGIHALDLFRWFLGEPTEGVGMVGTLAAISNDCEDNGFGSFRMDGGKLALLHASWTQWSPRFSFELTGAYGSLHASDRDQLSLSARGVSGRDVSAQTWRWIGKNTSWADDWNEFAVAIAEGRESMTSGLDGLKALRMALAIYESNGIGQVVSLRARD